MILASFSQDAGAALAAFLASMVEFVEALTIVLAVGVTRGWRGALTGAGLGLVTLAVMVAVFGPALSRIPLGTAQLVVGALLLLFGLRWLRKAMLRAAGVIALHDEGKAYQKETNALRAAGRAAGRRDPVAIATSFKAVVLEGVEVVFIVVGVSAGGAGFSAAVLGAAAAFVIVLALGLAIRRPLERVPENALKFVVGAVLTAFGLFWIGEGLGASWPGEDLALPVLIAGFIAIGGIGAAMARRLAVREA